MVSWRERLFPRWLWHLPAGHGQIALTFDDGPDPTSTPRLLSALRELSIPATMFMVGADCAAHLDLVRACSAAGHSVAIHGYHHDSFLLHSARWQRESILRAVAVLGQNGIPCQRLFRPPFGRFNPSTSKVLAGMDFRGVMWSQMPRDWRIQTPSKLRAQIVQHLHEGSIIVLHDRPQTIANVIACLPSVAAEVHRRGWHFVPLSHPIPLEPVRL